MPNKTVEELINEVSDEPTRKALFAMWNRQLHSMNVADSNTAACRGDASLLRKIKEFLISHNLFNIKQ